MCESAREQTSRTSKNISSSQTKYANLRITHQTIITSAVIIHLLLQYVLYPETFLHQVVRTLPNYILNELDPTVDNYGGRRIDWFNWNIYMPGFVCRCAKKAKQLGYDVIGLQHYGQQSRLLSRGCRDRKCVHVSQRQECRVFQGSRVKLKSQCYTFSDLKIRQQFYTYSHVEEQQNSLHGTRQALNPCSVVANIQSKSQSTSHANTHTYKKQPICSSEFSPALESNRNGNLASGQLITRKEGQHYILKT